LLRRAGQLYRLNGQELVAVHTKWAINAAAAIKDGNLRIVIRNQKTGLANELVTITPEGRQVGEPIAIKGGTSNDAPHFRGFCSAADRTSYLTGGGENMMFCRKPDGTVGDFRNDLTSLWGPGPQPCLSPDQTQIYVPFRDGSRMEVGILQVGPSKALLQHEEWFYRLEDPFGFSRVIGGLCVDAEGRLYVSTAEGIQVCDQAGRVNFIIPTPESFISPDRYWQVPHDVCFGGKELSELFIACGDKIYKRQTKVHGIVSGQMAPIKPAAPKL
jgi:hypothetical protein